MNLTRHSTPKTLTDSINLTDHGHEIFHGQWVTFSVGEWVAHLEKKAERHDINASGNCLELELLDYIAQKIRHQNYGAVCDYELTEARRQEEIEWFLFYFALSAEEERYFKERVGFIEDFSPYTAECADCNGCVSALESAISRPLEGEELCTRCLGSRYC